MSPGSPPGKSNDVVSERVPGGLRDYGRSSHQLVAIEVWDASARLPASILDALPAPAAAQARLLEATFWRRPVAQNSMGVTGLEPEARSSPILLHAGGGTAFLSRMRAPGGRSGP